MQKEHVSLFSEIKEIAGYLWERGWAEKNAGNFSIRLSAKVEENRSISHLLSEPFPELANQIFLVSAKGSLMRNMARKPKRNTLFLQIGSKGIDYHIIHPSRHTHDLQPTSELLTHLAIHARMMKTNINARVVMHTHVTELIALTHIPEFCNEIALNNLLWSMHPETVMFVPKGVGFVPFELPGSAAIARLTLEKLQKHRVAIWEKHGAFSVTTNLQESFDVLDILAKSAKIYFMVKNSVKKNTKFGLTEEQLEQLRGIEF